VKPARLYIKKKEIVSNSQGKQIRRVAYRSRKVAEDFEVSVVLGPEDNLLWLPVLLGLLWNTNGSSWSEERFPLTCLPSMSFAQSFLKILNILVYKHFFYRGLVYIWLKRIKPTSQFKKFLRSKGNINSWKSS
jgi:hypothetical protein